jgi:glutamate--cysteine ligase
MTFRGHIWTDTDPARCGFPDAAEDFSYARWIDWMLDVPMMFTKSGGVWRHAHGRTFRQWMEQGDEGRFPTEKDWDLHLTSVFPEVRVKQQIEVRMGDCVPLDLSAAFVALWEGLFYDRRALDQALALSGLFASFGSKADRFHVACKHGLAGSIGGRRLSTWAESVVDIARDGLTRVAPQDVALLAPLERVVASGESPAAHLLRALGGDFSPGNVLDHTRIDGTIV